MPSEDPRPRSSLPQRIGRYRIVDRVGRGAMGVVYAAHDDNMGRPVAVKVLMADLESDPETRARFYQEAQLAASLLHPNIITIFDAAEDQGRSYIVMQLLEGWPLAAYLKEPEAKALERKLDVMVQICEGLAAAHGRGIVHRDLKPGNLFVQSDGLVKILDFGVARVADSQMTRTGVMLGTPDYMSPEQARGARVDHRSDIFSVGAVFSYILTGRKPFPGPDLPAVLRQLQDDSPTPIREDEAPAELARVIAQAMAKEPTDRPQRVQDLLAGIVRFRRRYQADTRKLAARAGVRYNEISTVSLEHRAAGVALAVADDQGGSAVVHELRERYPVLAQRGGEGLEAIVFERSRITDLLEGLEVEERRLREDLQARLAWTLALDSADRALAGGDARAALQHADRVVRECPGSHRARELAARARTLVHEREALEARLEETLRGARAAVDRREWKLAITTCEEVLAAEPAHAPAAALLEEARQAVAREERHRALLVQGHLTHAAAAIEEQRFDDAERALAAAAEIDPRAREVDDLRHELEAGRAARARIDALAREAADEIRRARAHFRRGEYEGALVRLQRFAETASHEGAAAELQRLSALHDRMVAGIAARARLVAGLVQEAGPLQEIGAYDEALARVREAVRHDPTHDEAAALLDDLARRALDARIARERARASHQRQEDAAMLVAAARDAEARGYLAVAVRAAANAARLLPDEAEVAALLESLRARIAEPDMEPHELVGDPLSSAAHPPETGPRDSAGPRPSDAPVGHPDRRLRDEDDQGGVLAQMNQWASALFGRRSSNR